MKTLLLTASIAMNLCGADQVSTSKQCLKDQSSNNGIYSTEYLCESYSGEILKMRSSLDNLSYDDAIKVDIDLKNVFFKRGKIVRKSAQYDVWKTECATGKFNEFLENRL